MLFIKKKDKGDKGGTVSQKAKLDVIIYVLTFIYGHEVWIITERMRSWIQASKISFLHRVAGVSLRGRVRSSVIRVELRVESLLLLIKRNQLSWFRHLNRMPPCHPWEVF